MSGRHTGNQHSHTVEGTDPQLYVEVHEPQDDAGLRPVLLLHGFSSSSKLNWEDTGWLTALLAAGRRVITVDLPGHGRSGAPEDMDSYSPSRIRADLLQIVFDAGARPLRDGRPVQRARRDRLFARVPARLGVRGHPARTGAPAGPGRPNVADPLPDFDLIAAQRTWPTGRRSRTNRPRGC